MSVDNQIELIPSFDHGLSLGSTDEDEEKLNISHSDYVDRLANLAFKTDTTKSPI